MSSIDGVDQGDVDLQGGLQDWQVDETYSGLANGTHTITVTALGTHDPIIDRQRCGAGRADRDSAADPDQYHGHSVGLDAPPGPNAPVHGDRELQRRQPAGPDRPGDVVDVVRAVGHDLERLRHPGPPDRDRRRAERSVGPGLGGARGRDRVHQPRPVLPAPPERPGRNVFGLCASGSPRERIHLQPD